jgi:hypothetical protein
MMLKGQNKVFVALTLAQHFFRAKILQKLLGVNFFGKFMYSMEIVLATFVTSVEP